MSSRSRCYKSTFKSLDSIVLENSSLRCEWIPSYGSKMVSLQKRSVVGSREFLYQAKTPSLIKPEYGASFAQFDMSGFDECFPTIDECEFPIGQKRGLKVPDHGELWASAWDVAANTGSEISFITDSPQFGYRLQKTAMLEDDCLTSRYELCLLPEREVLPFIWTPHALFQVGANTRFIIPNHMNKIITVTDRSGSLGENRTVHTYPRTVDENRKAIDLSKIEPKESNNCEKYYFLDKLNPDDLFGFQDAEHQILMSVDSDKVPYLGIWKNQGGYNNDYNFALEPCTGIYDNLTNAYNNQQCASISKGETYHWSFSMRIRNL